MAEGYRCIGFDIEAHDYGTGGYPGELILRDIRSVHGSECKDAAVIVASPPCQGYSYRAMPWKKAKALPPPDNTLFNECFRIQREAIEAAGHYIPLVVENVRGAQKWVGRARANYGSFFLWGDVGMVGRRVVAIVNGAPAFGRGVQAMPREIMKYGKVCLSPEEWKRSQDGEQIRHPNAGYKTSGMNWSDQTRRGQDFTRIAGKQATAAGIKNKDADGYERDHPHAFGWKAPRTSSHSSKRKMASALIAKIPLPLSSYIARAFLPLAIRHIPG